MTKDDALKLALEVMHNQGDVGVDEWIATEAAINQALAAPVQPEQEPMALIRTWHKNGDQHAELVDWGMALQFLPDGEHCLYTTPPAAPMTEFEEAVAAVDNTLHHAIDYWQDKASEQAALLRECRAALDSLIEKKPELAALLCGSTTLGNLKASLHDYRVKGIFDDTPPSAQRQWVGLTDDEISHMWRNSPPASHDFARAIEAKLKERNT
jgi:hypothetical protein